MTLGPCVAAPDGHSSPAAVAALPTDGIDAPLPGFLDLPTSISGPSGQAFLREVAFVGNAGGGDATLDVAFTYSPRDPAPGSDLWIWFARVTTFGTRGLAHRALHFGLDPPRSRGGPHDWREDMQRLDVPGLFFRSRTVTGLRGALFGVARHSLVEVGFTAARGVPPAAEAAQEDARQEALALLTTLARALQAAQNAVREGSPAIVSMTARRRVPTPGAPPSEEPPLRIELEPSATCPADEQLRLWVAVGMGGRDERVSVRELRAGRALTLDPGPEAWTSRRRVDVFRVLEGDGLVVEHVGGMTLSPDALQWTWTAASPPGPSLTR